MPEPLARFEVLMLALRTVDGLDRRRYKSRFGSDVAEHHGPVLADLEATGLVAMDPDRLRPTRRGILFADEIAVRLLPAARGRAGRGTAEARARDGTLP